MEGCFSCSKLGHCVCTANFGTGCGHAWWKARLWTGDQGKVGEDDVALRHGKVVHHDRIWDGDGEVAHYAPSRPNLEVVQVGLLHGPVAEPKQVACASQTPIQNGTSCLARSDHCG